MVYTLHPSMIGVELVRGLCARGSHKLIFESQLPVATKPTACEYSTHLIGRSWAPKIVHAPVPKSHMNRFLSSPPLKALMSSAEKAQSKTAALWSYFSRR